MRTIYEFLVLQSTIVLSVSDATGMTHSAPLFFGVTEDLELYWLSSVKSMHSRFLALNRGCSIAAYRSTFEWREIAGVQMRGTAKKVDRSRRPALFAEYSSRFRLGNLLSHAIARSTMYSFRPEWMRYTDNQRRFGFRFELALGEHSMDADGSSHSAATGAQD
jgi:uncharacterized protein YhbP (UPF0306 family)